MTVADTVLVIDDDATTRRILEGVLRKAGYRIIVAHFNHKLRPDSDTGANIVEQTAARLNLASVIESGDVRAFADSGKLSIEEAARNLRYRFLMEQARQFHAQAVSVGHTADDQVETVLMHLLRGAGLSGLAGMSYRSLPNAWSETIPLARPLLGVWREQVWQYLDENGLSPSLDPSNLDLRILRNRLRHEAIPFLETYNPHFRQLIWQTAEILGGEDAVLQERLSTDWNLVVLEEHLAEIVIDAMTFGMMPLGMQRRIIKTAIQRLRPEARDVDFQVI